MNGEFATVVIKGRKVRVPKSLARAIIEHERKSLVATGAKKL